MHNGLNRRCKVLGIYLITLFYISTDITIICQLDIIY